MDKRSKIVLAIEGFDRWDQPWEFYASVYSAPKLDADDFSELQQLWAAATDSSIWLACQDLAQGCALADTRLSSSYPWLSAKARQHLVNAAAYQWR